MKHPLGVPTTAALVAAIALGGVFLLAADDPVNEMVRRSLVISRTEETDTAFDFRLTWSPPEGSSDVDDLFLGYMTLTVDDRGQVIEATGQNAIISGAVNEPTVFVNGTRVSSCDIGLCGTQSTLAGAFQTMQEDARTTITHHVINLEYPPGTHVEVANFQATGWTLREVELDFRYVTGYDAAVVGAQVTGVGGAEAFMEASAPGGHVGSVAQAFPPCSTASASVARGVGSITLSGDQQEAQTSCPALDYLPVATLWTGKASEWAVTGQVIGEQKFAEVRLHVMDLPEDPAEFWWPSGS